jgi:hypothetical protein
MNIRPLGHTHIFLFRNFCETTLIRACIVINSSRCKSGIAIEVGNLRYKILERLAIEITRDHVALYGLADSAFPISRVSLALLKRWMMSGYQHPTLQ